jgi:hypothetical protein
VNVRYDKETWIYYSIQEHDISMAIVVTNDVPTEKIAERSQEAKAKGDEIWNKAMAIQKQPPPPAQHPAPPPVAPAA